MSKSKRESSWVPVYASLWENPQVAQLSHSAFRIFMALITGEDARACPGIIRTDAKLIAARIPSITLEEAEDGLVELEAPGPDGEPPLIVRDERIVWLPGTWKFHQPCSHKNVEGWVKKLKAIGAEHSRVGVLAIAALLHYLRSEKDARYTDPVEASFPRIAARLDSGELRASKDAPPSDQRHSHSHKSDPQPQPPQAAAAGLGASPVPDMAEEVSGAPQSSPHETHEALISRLEVLGRDLWAAHPHLKPSPAFSGAERAALDRFVGSSPPEEAEARVRDLCRRAGESAFLALPMGEGPGTRRIDPTLGELLARADYLDGLLSGRWARGPGLRVVRDAGSVSQAVSRHPAIVAARRARPPERPARLEGDALKRTLADAHALLPDVLRREVCG